MLATARIPCISLGTWVDLNDLPPCPAEPAGEDQRAAPDTAGAGAQRHQGRHGHHAREGIQLRQVPAAASQGAGDGRVLAGARGNGAGDLPGEGGAGRHLVVAEGATELNLARKEKPLSLPVQGYGSD